MTKFAEPKFSSRPASDAYRSNWRRTFGRKTQEQVAAETFLEAFDRNYPPTEPKRGKRKK